MASPQHILYGEHTRSAIGNEAYGPRRPRDSQDMLTSNKQARLLDSGQGALESKADGAVRVERATGPELLDEASIPEVRVAPSNTEDAQSWKPISPHAESPSVPSRDRVGTNSETPTLSQQSNLEQMKMRDISGMPARPEEGPLQREIPQEKTVCPSSSMCADGVSRGPASLPESLMRAPGGPVDSSKPSVVSKSTNDNRTVEEGVSHIVSEDEEPVAGNKRGPGGRWVRIHIFQNENEADEWLGKLQKEQIHSTLRTNRTTSGTKKYMYCSACGHPSRNRRIAKDQDTGEAPIVPEMIMVHYLAMSSVVHVYSNEQPHRHHH
ncbi:hypothetical protein Pmar_PMAR011069, partial [Perkinsus marinus ATCC 50983]